MRLFISYAQQDKAQAQKLSARLTDAGLEVWNDETDLAPGDNWWLATGQALANADALIMLLSPDALKSEVFNRMFEFAFLGKKFEDRVIPVVVRRVDQSEIPWILRELGPIELSDETSDGDEFGKILERLQAAAR